MKRRCKTRDNHYVPQWYQKSFSISKDTKIALLDINPETILLDSGKRISTKALFNETTPKRCFYHRDLYTTFFHNEPCDEIENYFFGGIDHEGSIAIKALANDDLEKLPLLFNSIFKYIDIQKTRTPKGLDWLKSRFPHINSDDLLIEMQRSQQINCTLWAESVKEIVSAEDANVKFIFSDHPVTVYNRDCPPDSHDCTYPNDPRVEMIGTQTIFPLNYNNCLLLTHLDYAEGEVNDNLKEYREHHTPFRNTIARLDNIIRKRKLSDEEVLTINFIIKSRAKRYVAAGKSTWVYPEKSVTESWSKLGDLLMPPKNDLYKYGGEIYIGYEDGSTDYYDKYGRKRPVPEFLTKQPTKETTEDSDYCPCGSGRSFIRCCKGKSTDERTNSSQLSIRERNLLLANAILDIINFDIDGGWDECRRNITNTMIADIYKVYSEIWPLDTAIMDFIPRPDRKIFRSLYRGILHPYEIIPCATCLMFCFDEILIQNPFTNNNALNKKYRPVDHPEMYRLHAIKNIFLFISLLPFIKLNIVNLFPDPLEFSFSMREQIMDAATHLKPNLAYDEESLSKFNSMMKNEAFKIIISSDKNKLKDLISEFDKNLSEDEITRTHDEIMRIYSKDPLFDLNPNGDTGQGQYQIFQISPDPITSLFLAQATGSVISTSDQFIWKQICQSTSHYQHLDSKKKTHTPLALQKINLDFPFCENISELHKLTMQSKFRHVKNLLKNLWGIARNQNKPSKLSGIKPGDVTNGLSIATRNFLSDDSICPQHKNSLAVSLSCNLSFEGHDNNAVYRLLMAYAGHEKYLKHVPLSILLEFHTQR